MKREGTTLTKIFVNENIQNVKRTCSHFVSLTNQPEFSDIFQENNGFVICIEFLFLRFDEKFK